MSKSAGYCLMPNVISTVFCRGNKLFCSGVKNRGNRRESRVFGEAGSDVEF